MSSRVSVRPNSVAKQRIQMGNKAKGRGPLIRHNGGNLTTLLHPMTRHRFDLQDLPATPWKNGGGLTREVLWHPAGADLNGFDWRVSVAQIDTDGPFSAFPGVDRVITLIKGAGVLLRSECGQVQHRLGAPLSPFAFSGDLAIQGHLLDGACQVFNVLTRRAVCRAQVQVVRSACDWPAQSQGLFLALQGQWQLGGDEAQPLMPHQGLWWQGEALPWKLRPQGADPVLLALTVVLLAT